MACGHRAGGEPYAIAWASIYKKYGYLRKDSFLDVYPSATSSTIMIAKPKEKPSVTRLV